MRVAILWKQMSGFARASFAALADKDVEVLLVYPAALPEAPYEAVRIELDVPAVRWSASPPHERELTQHLEEFDPHAVLVSSWDVGSYRRASRALRGQTLRILSMDNPWRGSPKQWAGCAVSPLIIRPAYDAIFLPGDRQAEFAHRLGFGDERILWGVNTCDHSLFDAVRRRRNGSAAPQAFLFVGRLVPEKAVDILAAAYQRYRLTSSAPWPLLVCGTGPLEHLLAPRDGVEVLGFVQPDQLPRVFERAGCLVLPSRFEPWGIVIHEATSAGLPVICSTACGASTRLVLDGYNGAVVPTDDVEALAAAMRAIASPDTDRTAMGQRSVALAAQFTPDRWATYLVDRIPILRERLSITGRRL